jgi:hypothetical protein
VKGKLISLQASYIQMRKSALLILALLILRYIHNPFHVMQNTSCLKVLAVMRWIYLMFEKIKKLFIALQRLMNYLCLFRNRNYTLQWRCNGRAFIYNINMERVNDFVQFISISCSQMKTGSH